MRSLLAKPDHAPWILVFAIPSCFSFQQIPLLTHRILLFNFPSTTSPLPGKKLLAGPTNGVYRETRRLDGNSLDSFLVSSRSKNPTGGGADHTGENTSLSRRVCVAGTAKPRN